MRTPIARAALTSLLFALCASGPAGAEEPGLAIGSRAPAFELSDQNGARHSLDSLLARGRLAIVFYRSAVW